MLIHYNDAGHDEDRGNDVLRNHFMRDALAVNEFREDATEENRDKYRDKEARGFADRRHHCNYRHDEQTVLVNNFREAKRGVIAKERKGVAAMVFPFYEGGAEGAAP